MKERKQKERDRKSTNGKKAGMRNNKNEMECGIMEKRWKEGQKDETTKINKSGV